MSRLIAKAKIINLHPIIIFSLRLNQYDYKKNSSRSKETSSFQSKSVHSRWHQSTSPRCRKWQPSYKNCSRGIYLKFKNRLSYTSSLKRSRGSRKYRISKICSVSSNSSDSMSTISSKQVEEMSILCLFPAAWICLIKRLGRTKWRTLPSSLRRQLRRSKAISTVLLP